MSAPNQVNRFVHALKDELVKSALLAIHCERASHCSDSHAHSNGLLCEGSPPDPEGRPEVEYNEEDWVSLSTREPFWTSVAVFHVRVCVGPHVDQRGQKPELHHCHG